MASQRRRSDRCWPARGWLQARAVESGRGIASCYTWRAVASDNLEDPDAGEVLAVNARTSAVGDVGIARGVDDALRVNGAAPALVLHLNANDAVSIQNGEADKRVEPQVDPPPSSGARPGRG